jgi:beta-carotene 15,15'-dioxygenase
MIRIVLLIVGFVLLIVQQYIQPVPVKVQFIVFLIGIILLGVPHGAADLLVAARNTESNQRSFSRIRFFVNYLGRLLLFAAILWFFPLIGNLLFIVFAAYHFGETDLYRFNTNSIAGKLFVISYGLVILAVILMQHFEEVKPMLAAFDAGVQHAGFINWLDEYRNVILSFCGVFFFASTFFYFATSRSGQSGQGQFLIQFTLIVLILYNLPMMLGFTFYFIVWHSLLSLRNIVSYLRKDGLFSQGTIVRQVSFYSILAMVGICLFGLTGFMFTDTNVMVVYIFLGLAVLTAPHMQIMHDMYRSIRYHRGPVESA